jgi:8-oxo-dGTP pyrophosphatase MutT (NUDIX family)
MPISDYLRNLRRKIGHDPVLIPAVCALVFNGRGEVLICRTRDDGKWHTVGGTMDPGEEPTAAVVREVKEETGLDVVAERVVGVYAGPFIRYANGDQVHCVTIAFACRPIDQNQQPFVADDESLEVRYFDPQNLPEMPPYDRDWILQAMKNDARARFL